MIQSVEIVGLVDYNIFIFMFPPFNESKCDIQNCGH
uniref:Uncharacterized protein n=1 Tax=Rhizophora mucronata TaxID=61149 RepID=A0A2P2Q5J3_RHIMU